MNRHFVKWGSTKLNRHLKVNSLEIPNHSLVAWLGGEYYTIGRNAHPANIRPRDVSFQMKCCLHKSKTPRSASIRRFIEYQLYIFVFLLCKLAQVFVPLGGDAADGVLRINTPAAHPFLLIVELPRDDLHPRVILGQFST